MRAILGVVLVCSLALGLIGAAVFGANDKQTFVSPPEATVEGFVRSIVAGRYSRATPHLSRRASTKIHEGELRNFANEIKNHTRVLELRGEPISINGDFAEAVAFVRTASDERRMVFRLVREDRVWFIDELPSIESGKQR